MLLLATATFFSEYAIGALPAIIGPSWLRGSEHTHKVLLEATSSGLGHTLIPMRLILHSRVTI